VRGFSEYIIDERLATVGGFAEAAEAGTVRRSTYYKRANAVVREGSTYRLILEMSLVT
jgi:hypothetical protein